MTRIPTPERRAALVDAALRVVARDGVAGASTRVVAAEAGMPQASVHYVFSSRDELMTALVAHAIDREQEALAPATRDDAAFPDIRSAIRSGLEHYLDAVRRHPATERAMFELTQFALRDPERSRLARRQYAGYRALAAESLAIAAEKTGCRWRRPLDELAVILVALTDGLTLGWLVDADERAAAAVMDFAADALAAYADAAADPGADADAGSR